MNGNLNNITCHFLKYGLAVEKLSGDKSGHVSLEGTVLSVSSLKSHS